MTKIKTRADLRRLNPNFYRKLLRENRELLDETFGKNNSIFWTKTSCIASAKKYKTFSKWTKNQGGAVKFATKNGILDLCKKHMEAAPIYWNKKSVLTSAKKYKRNIDWLKGESGAYQFAKKDPELFKICIKHMDSGYGKWTSLNACIKIAKKFTSRSVFGKKYRSAYKTILKNGWEKECFSHMQYLQKPWTNKEIIADAKKYSSIKDWESNSSAPQIARKRKLMSLCSKHMRNLQKTYIKNLDTNKIYKSQVDAAKSINLKSVWNIGNRIKRGLVTGGYRWAYCDKNGKVIK